MLKENLDRWHPNGSLNLHKFATSNFHTVYKKTRQTQLAVLDITLKQGIVSECISIHVQWQDTLDLKGFCFWVWLWVFFFFFSPFLSLMVQNLLLLIILF